MSGPTIVETLTFRPMRASDRAFVCCGWKESAMRTAWAARYRIDKAAGYAFLNAWLGKHFEQCQVLVASFTEDDDTLLGFLAYAGKVPIYTFVKGGFRHFGVADAMAKAAGVELVDGKLAKMQWRPDAAARIIEGDRDER